MAIWDYPVRKLVGQCARPSGFFGRLLARGMNQGHGPLTLWGLKQLSIAEDASIVDIGCGGGGTVRRLARLAPGGKVVGIDFSPDSLRIARKTNRKLVDQGRVEIQEASVGKLPFADQTFDLATAIETHFFWPDLPANFREVLRVLKPGGQFMVLAAIYKGSPHAKRDSIVLNVSQMAYLGKEDFEELFAAAGFCDIEVVCDPKQGSICAMASRPSI